MKTIFHSTKRKAEQEGAESRQSRQLVGIH
jgi:hypothetical protein